MPTSPLSRRVQRALGILAILCGLWLCFNGLAVVYAAHPGLSPQDRGFYYLAPLVSLLLGLSSVILGLRTTLRHPHPPARGISLAFAFLVMLLAARLVAPFLPAQPTTTRVFSDAPLTDAELRAFWLNLGQVGIGVAAGVALHYFLRHRHKRPPSDSPDSARS